MAKTVKKKAKPVRKAKAKTAAKRSGSARRKMTAKRSTARKSKARREGRLTADVTIDVHDRPGDLSGPRPIHFCNRPILYARNARR